jgi:5-methyltetrahydrofolate--homocysteine methyltransferase
MARKVFQTWQLRGRYPNRGYPKLFNDEAVGKEAKKLFDDAQAMLKLLMARKQLKAKGIVGIYPANSVGDDIEVYEDESRSKVIAKYHGLRQQAQKEVESNDPYYCLSDFIAPKETGIPDYIGLFAVSAGFGCDELAEKYKEENDDYNVIMVKALADRFVSSCDVVRRQKKYLLTVNSIVSAAGGSVCGEAPRRCAKGYMGIQS